MQKDEIKEILIRTKEQQAIDVFKEFIETKGNLVTDYSLETYMQVILDYITNLQEDNKMYAQLKDEYEDIIDKALDKLYCYGEAFDRKILQQFQKEMEIILKGSDNNER